MSDRVHAGAVDSAAGLEVIDERIGQLHIAIPLQIRIQLPAGFLSGGIVGRCHAGQAIRIDYHRLRPFVVDARIKGHLETATAVAMEHQYQRRIGTCRRLADDAVACQATDLAPLVAAAFMRKRKIAGRILGWRGLRLRLHGEGHQASGKEHQSTPSAGSKNVGNHDSGRTGEYGYATVLHIDD